MGHRFQVKMAVHKDLSASKGRGQLIFLPYVVFRAGKNGFGVRSVAAEFTGEPYDPFDVSPRGVLPPLTFKVAHRFAGQILDENRIFLVRLVSRRRRLEVKSNSTRIIILKFGQLTDLFASHAHGYLPIDN